MGKDINMDALKTHQFHFDKQMITLYDKFVKMRIPENHFELIEYQKLTFSFGGYITYYAFNQLNRFLYYTRPKDILEKDILEKNSKYINEIYGSISLLPEEHWPEKVLWQNVIEKIEQYPVNHQI